MHLLLAAMLPVTPNTEEIASAVVGSIRGVRVVNGTKEAVVLAWHRRSETRNRETGIRGLHECNQWNSPLNFGSIEKCI